MPSHFQVIVIGGGHAGCEAALAAARMGCKTLLITQNIETLGQMSCNPAIGGIGKGHLVKEIDAMGGAMAHIADRAGIQFRILNASKGPAVRATRAQCDRMLYKWAMREVLENQQNLQIFQQEVVDIQVSGEQVTGVVTGMGLAFSADAVVLTTGTFLGGKIHVGLEQSSGGRAGDAPSIPLALRLRELMPRVGRLKTGTPPRIDAKSIDFSGLLEQPGDFPTPLFSFMGKSEDHPRQISCWITHTNERTHDIIRSGFDRSPMFTGIIEGTGPRYCPSVEDKVNRFADKTSHQIFIEPEGLNSREIYPNGISTSLPYDVQLAFVRSIQGFENAHITRPGYAIEYDYFDPRDLKKSFETKALQGLFFAGQINGTTGYEEAAAQGLLAGINAARRVQGEAPWLPARHEAYLGVMIDDLTTRGLNEPYRMFTSRAEHRLLLREDNADLRLSETAYQLGLLGETQWAAFQAKKEAIAALRSNLDHTLLKPHQLAESAAVAVFGAAPTHSGASLSDLLRRPEGSIEVLQKLDWLTAADPLVAEQVEIQIKYAGYIERQAIEIDRNHRNENTVIPDHFDFAGVTGLSNEVKSKLLQYRPQTLGQAGRISGITPAAISLLLVHLKKLGQLQRVGV